MVSQNLDISLNVVTAVTDVAIAGCLTYLLQKSVNAFSLGLHAIDAHSQVAYRLPQDGHHRHK